MSIFQELDRLLRTNIRKYKVPGASLAVLSNGRIRATSAAGVVNIDTGVKTTPDSVFQIGSISKPHTATLIMQLVDKGLVSLDAPVSEYLPEFRVARYDISRAVTIRQFLSHTSGIDGDYFVDSGRGDEAVERFVDKCAMVPSLFEPGEMMSYCNLGYAVLGRIIEVIHRKTYDQALKDHLFVPLGMDHAFSRPEDALRFNSAIGHIQSISKPGKFHVTRVPYLSFGQKAAGATPSMTASDLLRFAQMHLNDGKNDQGQRILSRKSTRMMQKRQTRMLKYSPMAIDGWGLGWMLMNWDGERIFAHDGATIGQFAFLRIVPRKKLAVALLTNGGDAKGLYKTVFNEILGSLVKKTEPELPDSAKRQPDLTTYTGTYENIQNRISLTIKKGQLSISNIHLDSNQSLYPKKCNLLFIDKNTARLDCEDEILNRTTLHFSQRDDSGKPSFVQTGFRQYKLVS